jgi:hypothetical protein
MARVRRKSYSDIHDQMNRIERMAQDRWDRNANDYSTRAGREDEHVGTLYDRAADAFIRYSNNMSRVAPGNFSNPHSVGNRRFTRNQYMGLAKGGSAG